jgi:hypothetical protein
VAICPKKPENPCDVSTSCRAFSFAKKQNEINKLTFVKKTFITLKCAHKGRNDT